MSDSIATYSFLPWLRQGLANQIAAGGSDNGRATINVQLQLTGAGIGAPDKIENVNRPVALFGPGDIQGIDSRAIFRTEPHNWITNFEPNYLPAIEFYDEDMAWRYTPLAPDANGRLQPWLALIVLEEREKDPEFKEGGDVRNKPLPYIEVTDMSLFPPADQLWAWAHVHVNRSLAANDTEFVSSDMNAVLSKLQAVLTENPDLAYSRILCPRKLGGNRGYHAFLMPTFESGRRGGLGLDPYTNPALPAVGTSAWEPYTDRPEATRYPYYFRWYFRTGGTGDFESLVRLLKPQKVDHRVGRRDLDVQSPGVNVRGIQEGRPDLGGILKLGGALRVPNADFTADEMSAAQKYENWATPYPQPIQQDIAALVNLADDYAGIAAAAANKDAGIVDADDPNQGDPDPVITPPLYGTWHAMTKRLLVERNGDPVAHRTNWVHELNLDPRFRIAAGYGTRVVQDQQEKLMEAAWSQIGRVLEANQRIRLAHLALGASTIWYDRHLQPLLAVNRQNLLLLTAPLNKRVLHEGSTVHQQLTEGLLQPAMTSAPLRRVMRPRARLMTTLPFTAQQLPGDLLAGANDGSVSAAPPKVTPLGATTIGDAAKAATPQNAPSFIVNLLHRFPWLPWTTLFLALIIIVVLFFFLPFAAVAVIAVSLGGGAFYLSNILTQWGKAVHASSAIADPAPPVSSIDQIPPLSDFRLTEPGSGFTPMIGTTDSFEAARFKLALKDVSVMVGAIARAGQVTAKKQLDLAAIAGSMAAGIDPKKTIPKRVLGSIFLPPRVVAEIGEDFVEAMAYPELDTPMYFPLKEISSELFLPNIMLIAHNSITLLETNEKFVEAYMVGLNHEFARELLWREYPTDQRGSYFRQFWDVSSYFNAENLDDASLKEKLRDITRLDHWGADTGLDAHNNRLTTSGRKATLVLVIRGELLKRYPTAVIYAQRARWQFTDGKIDTSLERRFDELTPAEEAAPPKTKIRTPLYDAKVDPDIYFFGFDLTVDEARGGTGEPGNDDPGWFFVIKQRPGEPTFGLEIDKADQLNVWNDLSWPDIQPGDIGSFIQVTGAVGPLTLVAPPSADEKFEQYGDDKNVTWDLASMSSAELAYLFFRAPVLVGIHASEMLGST